MTIHRIRVLGDPVLRTRCEPVSSAKSPAVRLVAHDLQETLRDFRARQGFGRAIAAPQIGAPVRMIYVEIGEPWFLINPEIVDIGNEDFEVWDDCFSFPDIRVLVQRAYKVSVKYLDRNGDEQVISAEGPLAELLQHEIDHLDGVLAVDLTNGVDRFCMQGEWNKRFTAEDRYGLPTERPLPKTAQNALLID